MNAYEATFLTVGILSFGPLFGFALRWTAQGNKDAGELVVISGLFLTTVVTYGVYVFYRWIL